MWILTLTHDTFWAHPGDQISKYVSKVDKVFNDSQTSHTCFLLFIYYEQEIWKCSHVLLIFCWPKLGKHCSADSCIIKVIAAVSVTVTCSKNKACWCIPHLQSWSRLCLTFLTGQCLRPQSEPQVQDKVKVLMSHSQPNIVYTNLGW